MTPTQMLSCKYCEIFKNSFFYRTPPVAAILKLQRHFPRGFLNQSHCENYFTIHSRLEAFLSNSAGQSNHAVEHFLHFETVASNPCLLYCPNLVNDRTTL